MPHRFLITGALWIGLYICSAAQTANIVFVLVDDQGWNGTAFRMAGTTESGSDYYHTPNIVDLGESGTVFSRAYAPGAKCSPTRNSIMTGQTTATSRFTNTTKQVTAERQLIEPSSNNSINGTLTTFPELIVQQNSQYMTAHYGKWHLGNKGPEEHGFDRSDGNTTNSPGDQGGEVQSNPKLIYSITDSAMNFMTDAVNAGRPFYVQLSHYAVHTPLEATAEMTQLYANQQERPVGDVHDDPVFGAMTEDLDKSIGTLLAKIDELGIANNTYVVYMSDNGAPRNLSSNAPLKTGKTFIDEGGIRVPMIIRGPGIGEGASNELPVVGYDLYPTFVEWALGTTASVPDNVEGESIASKINQAGNLQREKPLVFHSPHYDINNQKVPRSALIDGDWKLLVNYETGDFSLYDLSNDIGESQDVSGQEADRKDSLLLLLRDYLKAQNAQMPALNPEHSMYQGTEPDVDGDGLNDEWEYQEMLTVSYGSDDDPDEDGVTNIQEYNMQTDPYVDNNLNSIGGFDFGLRIYPTQTQSNVTIEGLLKGDRLMVTDMRGKKIKAKHVSGNLDLSSWKKGVYHLAIVRDRQVIVQQEIVRL